MSLKMDYNGNKGFRLLKICEKLNRGKIIKKSKLVDDFVVTQNMIQRQI